MGDNKRKSAGASARGASAKDQAKGHKKSTTRGASSPDQTPPPPTKSKGIQGMRGGPQPAGTKDPSRRCTATANRTGKRCGAPAIKGGTVCRMHGGALPQVKNKARERLLALVDPALAALHAVLVDPKADDSTKVRAALGILDRTGHGPGAKLEIGGPSAFDQIALEALQVDRSTGGDEPKQVEGPTHTWEDVDQFSKDAQGEAWRALEASDDSDLKSPEPFDGTVVVGQVLSDDILPDYARRHERDPSEMAGGVGQPNGRRSDDPPAYWPDDER